MLIHYSVNLQCRMQVHLRTVLQSAFVVRLTAFALGCSRVDFDNWNTACGQAGFIRFRPSSLCASSHGCKHAGNVTDTFAGLHRIRFAGLRWSFPPCGITGNHASTPAASVASPDVCNPSFFESRCKVNDKTNTLYHCKLLWQHLA